MFKTNKIISVILLVLFSNYFASMSPVLINSEENGTADNDVTNVLYHEVVTKNITSEYENRLKEDVKERILRNLFIKEAPNRHVPLPLLQTLQFWSTEASGLNKKSLEEFTRNETAAESRLNATLKTRTAFLLSDVENSTCFDENGHPCIRFHFEILPQIQNKNFEFVELWLHKKQGVTEYTIILIINENDQENRKLTTTVYNQNRLEGWSRFNVSHIQYDENVTSLDLEIYSDSADWCLEFDKNNKPFLLLKIEKRLISKRAIRDCTTETTTCCRENYYVEFKDVGWSDWIVEPQGFDANYCKGSCTSHVGLPQNSHGRIFMQF